MRRVDRDVQFLICLGSSCMYISILFLTHHPMTCNIPQQPTPRLIYFPRPKLKHSKHNTSIKQRSPYHPLASSSHPSPRCLLLQIRDAMLSVSILKCPNRARSAGRQVQRYFTCAQNSTHAEQCHEVQVVLDVGSSVEEGRWRFLARHMPVCVAIAIHRG